MNTSKVLISQYLAALEMLKQTIMECPEERWDRPDDKVKFWNVAYHALFYVHLYLQDSAQAFVPWIKHQEGYHQIGKLPDAPAAAEPYTQESVLEYLTFCQHEVRQKLAHMNLEAASGFDWLPFSKFELHIYSIRHIQQHVGELMERLGSGAGIDIDWVGAYS